MTCAAFVCTASSSASRKPTAMTLPRRACALPFSSREPTPACCVQNSLRSCPPVHPETPVFGPPLIVSRLRSIAAARRKNSSPENLTHLHYNLLGKDSRVLESLNLIRMSTSPNGQRRRAPRRQRIRVDSE